MAGDQGIEVQGYKWYGFNRQALHVRARKASGGVGILIRESLLSDYSVTIIDKCYEGIIGVQLQHKVSQYSMLIYSCYLPPENSPWGRDATGFYTHLLSQAYVNSDVDSILLCGDFNSRVGSLDDSIVDIDNLPKRNNLDEIVNGHGRSLIEFLHESKYCILNGRSPNEICNAFTCDARGGKHGGMSVVDYFLVPHDVLPYCSDFNVISCKDIVTDNNLQQHMNHLSKLPDHAFLTCNVTINVILEQDAEPVKPFCESVRKYNFGKMSEHFMKSELCREAFIELINTIEHSRNEQDDLDDVYTNFTNVVFNEMNEHVPYYEFGVHAKKRFKPKKSFWNEELYLLWSDMNSKEKLASKCKNSALRKKMIATYRLARQLFDKKYRYFERKSRYEFGENIENLTTKNPKLFWEELSKLGPRNKKVIPIEVYENENTVNTDPQFVLNKWKEELSTLYNGFVNVDHESSMFKEEIRQTNITLETEMHNPKYNATKDLNCDIDIGEVRKVVLHSKNRKSPGVDRLPNEIYKCAIVIQTLQKIFKLWESSISVA